MAEDFSDLFPANPPEKRSPFNGLPLQGPAAELITEAHTDGGCRGNPGPAGYGVYIRHQGQIVTLSGTMPRSTNNEAEYEGLLACLRWAVSQRLTRLRVFSDSELIVNQMTGRYSVGLQLRRYYLEACQLTLKIGDVSFTHVRRERNREADTLANAAMDAAGFPRVPPTRKVRS